MVLLAIPTLVLSLSCVWLPFHTDAGGSDTQAKDLNLEFNPEGCELPCVWGITPGQTEINEALDIVTSTVPDEQIGGPIGTFWIRDSNENQVFIELHQSGPQNVELVSQITVLMPYGGNLGTLGDFLGAGYHPSQVFRGDINPPNEVNLLITFDQDGLVVEIHDTQISPKSFVTTLYVLDPDLSAILVVKDLPEISWIGFAPAEDYLNLPSPPE
ncbi:hypothetical protein DWB58_31270 [candidate division KSB1 bacterium]|nr:hypothetical protein [candidate division KSB1 bacterium]